LKRSISHTENSPSDFYAKLWVANNYDVSIKRHNCTSGMILRPELAAGMAKLPFKLGVLRKRERLIFRPPEPNPAAAKRNNYFPSCTHPTTTLPSLVAANSATGPENPT
jgi:hypothetical protein